LSGYDSIFVIDNRYDGADGISTRIFVERQTLFNSTHVTVNYKRFSFTCIKW